MAWALEICFDDATETEVRRRWDTLIAAGVPCLLPGSGARPHVSLAVARDIDMTALPDALNGIAEHAPAELTFASVGAFPTAEGVVFLAPVVTAELLRWHAEVWRVFIAHAQEPWQYYAPDQWSPHMTMAYGLNKRDMMSALDYLLGMPLPLAAQLSALVIVNATPTQVHEIWRAPLRRGDAR